MECCVNIRKYSVVCASQLFSNVVNNNLTDEAMVEEIVPEVEAEVVEEDNAKTKKAK